MAERKAIIALRLLFQASRFISGLLLALEMTLLAVAWVSKDNDLGGYVGTNLSSDATFFAGALSPLLGLAGLALLATSAVALAKEPPEDRGRYVRGLYGGLIVLLIAVSAGVLGFSFLGGGIIPH